MAAAIHEPHFTHFSYVTIRFTHVAMGGVGIMKCVRTNERERK